MIGLPGKIIGAGLEQLKPDGVKIFFQTGLADVVMSAELSMMGVLMGLELIPPDGYSSATLSNYSSLDTHKETNMQFKEVSREDFTIPLTLDNSEVVNNAVLNVRSIVEGIKRLLMTPIIYGPNNKKPPLCRFVWGTFLYTGYVSRLEEKYTFFNAAGYPVRAVITLTFKPVSSSVEMDTMDSTSHSRKAWIIKSGDRLDSIANRFYGDPSLWRYIAEENNIENPIDFPQPGHLGQTLIIPDLGLLG